VHPPRGRASSVFELDKEISVALFACRELIINGDDSIWYRILEIFSELKGEDKEFQIYLSKYFVLDALKKIMKGELIQSINDSDLLESLPQTFLWQLIIIGLVHRAFKGAWEKHGHPGLLQDHPQDVFRKYLYGKRRESITYHTKLCKEKFPDLYKSFLETSKRYYLSDPGAAVTKTFKFSF
jgi:hypothetical protein